MTYTYSILEISKAAFEEIQIKLEEAGYHQAFHNDDDELLIDMHGIALREEVMT